MENLKQIVNPYLPSWEYIPDGEPYVFGDRVYVYGSHDKFNGDFYCMLDYVCWSAPVDDLGDWRYEGVIFRKDQDPGNEDSCQHFAITANTTDIIKNRNMAYLRQFPNVVFTQHMAFYTQESVDSMVRTGIEGLADMAAGRTTRLEVR